MKYIGSSEIQKSAGVLVLGQTVRDRRTMTSNQQAASARARPPLSSALTRSASLILPTLTAQSRHHS